MFVKRKDLEAIEEGLCDIECSFWACDGPDSPFVHMKTCSVCQLTQELRRIIKEGKEIGC